MSREISFKSKIQFVDREQFKKIVQKSARWKKSNIDHNSNYMKYGMNFHTTKIRTCTAGGFIIPQKKSCGFHILNSAFFNEKLDWIFQNTFFNIQPERALLIGSKKYDGVKYSLENFKKIKEIVTSKVKDVSIFECHRFPYSESNFHYSASKDTWTILGQYNYKGKDIQVTTLKDLKRLYKKITIAKGDRLFINGTEILPKNCPRIFLDKQPLTTTKSYFRAFIYKITSFFKHDKH